MENEKELNETYGPDRYGPVTSFSMLSRHISLELLASRVYLYFSQLCGYWNLDNYSKLFSLWSKEEHKHANQMLDFLGEVGYRVKPDDLEWARFQSSDEDPTLYSCLKGSYEIERLVGSSIYKIHKVALEEGNYALVDFISPFSRLVPRELNEKETHMYRVKDLGERTANDTLLISGYFPEEGK